MSSFFHDLLRELWKRFRTLLSPKTSTDMAIKVAQPPGPRPQDLRIAIIGAGMGGLASALALAKKGFTDIHVYEAASNLGFVGAGIQLAPNLVRILTRLGCWEAIEKGATEILETSIRGIDISAEGVRTGQGKQYS